MKETTVDISFLVDILHKEKCSCVVCKNDKVSLFHQRGIKDLLLLYNSSDSELEDALVADKVVVKGAAALMILGKVKAIHVDVISIPALKLLENAHIEVEYASLVPNIINRSGTGICPVEKLCSDCRTAEECLPLIKEFATKNNFFQSGNQ